MSWAMLAAETVGVINKKLATKWKRAVLEIETEIQFEMDKPFRERDMNLVSHLKRKDDNLKKLFRKEILGNL